MSEAGSLAGGEFYKKTVRQLAGRTAASIVIVFFLRKKVRDLLVKIKERTIEPQCDDSKSEVMAGKNSTTVIHSETRRSIL